ncbi:MAG: NAD(P)H-binding protein [Bacteroidetes bacterium]|nr:NAD(P)H-binding protein [Bacteroidota bacterium]
MDSSTTHAVTGAFGYSGKYIARLLLEKGVSVHTLTNSKDRPTEYAEQITVHPLKFDDEDELARSLEGCSVLYNTYWIRFNYKTANHSIAVENSLKLFEAAKKAGVQRIVHSSITNPDINSPLPYFSGKAILEQAIKDSGLSYAILRPAILFGEEDILINNIAWTLRKFPIVGIFGDGKYKLQPIWVDDYARMAVEQGMKTENIIMDAVGPETFAYTDLVKMIGKIIGRNRILLRMPDWFGLMMTKIIGAMVHDILVTKTEIKGLKSNLLHVDSEPRGTKKLTEWIEENKSTVGMKYANELQRRTDRA